MSTISQDTTPSTYLVPSPLSRERWKPFEGLEYTGVVSFVSLIAKYWDVFMGGPLAVVPGDDGGIYDQLFTSLEFLLDRTEIDSPRILELIPENGPDGDTAAAWSYIGHDIFDNIARARSILRREAIRREAPLSDNRLNAYLGFYDHAIKDIADTNRQQVTSHIEAHPGLRLLVGTSKAQDDHVTKKSKGKGGRPQVAISYEDAQRAHWDIVTELQAHGAYRTPAQHEVAKRLSDASTQVGKTTFGNLVKRWRDEGKMWPPPDPDLS